MQKIKFFMIVFLSFFLNVSSGFCSHLEKTDSYSDKPIHVFFEALATMPAFLGMIEMVQLPAEDPKVFLWHRFLNRSELFDLNKINAIEVKSEKIEGNVYYAKHDLRKVLKEVLKKYPSSPLIIYTNMNNYKYLFDGFLRDFPKERVKRIHFYEDGVGELYSYENFFNALSYSKQDIQDLENYYYGDMKNRKLPQHAKYMMHRILPTSYYFYGFETATKTILNEGFLKQMEGASFVDVDFKKLSKKLSPQQKDVLFKLLGFDYDKYKKIFQKQKVFMYFGGFYLRGYFPHYMAEFNHILHLMKKYPDHYFLFKPHPSWDSFNRKEAFKKVFNNRIELVDQQLPYETFILAGLVPDKVSGRSSSLFFTLSDEMIDSYISHPAYENALTKLGIISKDKEVDLKSFVPQKPLFCDQKIMKDGKEDYLISVSNDSVFLYNEKKTYQKKEFGQDTFIHAEGKWFKYQMKESGLYLNPVEVFVLNHPSWKDILTKNEEGKYCRFQSNDCGVLKTEKSGLEVCWNQGGCEFFEKGDNHEYFLKN